MDKQIWSVIEKKRKGHSFRYFQDKTCSPAILNTMLLHRQAFKDRNNKQKEGSLLFQTRERSHRALGTVKR